MFCLEGLRGNTGDGNRVPAWAARMRASAWTGENINSVGNMPAVSIRKWPDADPGEQRWS